MTHQKHSMHDTDTREGREHQQWLETLETWHIEHAEALAKLTKMKAALMEHDAEIIAQLAQIRRHQNYLEFEARRGTGSKNGDAKKAGVNPFGSKEEHQKEHRALRSQMRKSAETHQRTLEALNSTIDTMRGIRADSFNDTFGDRSEADDAELIRQAGLESFPASDPPSYNPSNI